MPTLKITTDLATAFEASILDGSVLRDEEKLRDLTSRFKSMGDRKINPLNNDNYSAVEAIDDFVEHIKGRLNDERVYQLTSYLAQP